MPDRLLPDAGLDDLDVLRAAAAAAVLALPGVVRLDPTLGAALHRLRTTTATRAGGAPPAEAAADGIRLTRNGETVDVHVDVTLTTDQPANVLAQAIQAAPHGTVGARHLEPGRISVAVLRLRA